METGLRDRKKAATRRALHEATLRLALAEGLDAVTVEAVADAANVSRRTFSNYFASKEDALLYGERIRIEELLDAVRARPPAEPPWCALTAAARSQYGHRDAGNAELLAQLRLVLRHPSLLTRQVAVQSALEHDLAVEIAARAGAEPDEPLRCRVMAAVFLATLRAAFILWADGQGPPTLTEAVTAGLDLAGQRFQ